MGMLVTSEILSYKDLTPTVLRKRSRKTPRFDMPDSKAGVAMNL